MKWAHLPNNGGIYAQNPALLDRFYYILAERSKYEAEKEQKRQRESGPKNLSRSAANTRRRAR